MFEAPMLDDDRNLDLSDFKFSVSESSKGSSFSITEYRRKGYKTNLSIKNRHVLSYYVYFADVFHRLAELHTSTAYCTIPDTFLYIHVQV